MFAIFLLADPEILPDAFREGTSVADESCDAWPRNVTAARSLASHRLVTVKSASKQNADRL